MPYRRAARSPCACKRGIKLETEGPAEGPGPTFDIPRKGNGMNRLQGKVAIITGGAMGIVYLASDEASWTTGAHISVDGGWSAN